jgi:hypothetical protein
MTIRMLFLYTCIESDAYGSVRSEGQDLGAGSVGRQAGALARAIPRDARQPRRARLLRRRARDLYGTRAMKIVSSDHDVGPDGITWSATRTPRTALWSATGA